jgi:MoxR-like ATPase
MDMSKAMAFVNGRDYVLPEDVQQVAKPVLCHRLVLNGKARMSHTTEEQIIDEVISKIVPPKIK